MIKNKIFRHLILFTTIPLLIIATFICIFMYQKNTKDVRDEITDKLNGTIDSINETLVKYIDKSSYIITNQYLIHHIQKDYSNDLEQMVYFMDNINAMIGEAYTDNVKSPYIIHAYNETLFAGKFVEGMDSMEGNESARRAMKAQPTEIVWEPEATLKNGLKYITFYRNIVNIHQSVGILEVNIPYNALETKMDTVGVPENGFMYSYNEKGSLLYMVNLTNRSITDISEVTPKAYIMVSGTVKSGHTITAATPKKVVHLKNLITFAVVSFFFLIYIALMLLASKITAQKITGNMESFINKIKRNDNMLLHDDLIQIKGSDEVSILKLKFKELISRMNEMYKEMVSVKLANSAMEIELLQARINPHLLYNSLSVIKWTALWNKDRKTVELIDAMTKYYRTALSKGNNIISIASELDMIHEYVQINRFAHSASYELQIEVDEGIMDCYTLKHLLQPIVENSVLHGLNGQGEGARVIIKGYREQADIVFEVSDNGRGMEPETIAQIMNFNFTSGYGGYGVRNVMKRIQAYYGHNYGLHIESEVGSGTKVIVRIEGLSEQQLKERMQSSISPE
ncbi:sensor histidine kinase [Paenibacillus eucommiae]|uniref:Sensor histidine kinase YesM n=1 Tax=Paenibacillus eucommiae TaxID=1355755 RepID=A0ABS4J1G2_9BACL|nr:histidine kinase [Paenibacillus eucommiae]MBP1993667.1 sensor histidine kinase YesM [Paenibacillus eucommiae]